MQIFCALLFSAVFLLCPLLNISAQTFTRYTFEAGLLHQYRAGHYGGGVSFYDFNKDGWDDVSLVDINLECKFFQNNGDSTFTLLPAFFPAAPTIPDVKQLIWVDYDNDGDADISITTYERRFRLYKNNGNLQFTEVATSVGFPHTTNESFGHCWGDYDRDGDLDVYFCNYDYFVPDATNYLFKNNGDGTFTDATNETGTSNGYNMSLQSVFIDYDNDGWSDLFIINDRYPCFNTMYHNDGGTFSDVTQDVELYYNILAMSNSWADFDNDGDFDLYITNEWAGNLFHRNENGEYFTEIAEEAGVVLNDFSWAASWLDYDLDGFLDLHICVEPLTVDPGQNRFFRNNGDGTFSDYSEITGISPDMNLSHGAAWGDFNNDGHPDIVTCNDFPEVSDLWLNSGGNGHHYCKVSLEGRISNRDGIGSRIELYAGGQSQTRFTICGESYLSQNSQRHIFGLAETTVVDSLIVKWPSGFTDRFYDIQADQTLHIIEGSSISVNLGNSPQSLCSGEIELDAGPQFNSYLWSTGSTDQTIIADEPGTYWVEVTTPEGLSAVSDTITIVQPIAEEPVADIYSPSCPGIADGYISLSFVNDYPEFDSFVVWDNGQSGFNLSGLLPGDYSCTYYFGNGCEASFFYTLNEPAYPIPLISSSDALCHGSSDGFIEVTNAGSAGILEVSWSNGLSGAFIDNLSAGEYSFILTDTIGCNATGSTVIGEPTPLNMSLEIVNALDDTGGSAVPQPSGGTPPYSYSWSNGSTSEVQSDLIAGNYSVTLIDANGCTFTLEFEIVQEYSTGLPEERIIQNPLIFPNPGNGIVHFDPSVCADIQAIVVYNMAGEPVWNKRLSRGTCQFSIAPLPSGSYVIELVCSNRTIREKYLKIN